MANTHVQSRAQHTPNCPPTVTHQCNASTETAAHLPRAPLSCSHSAALKQNSCYTGHKLSHRPHLLFNPWHAVHASPPRQNTHTHYAHTHTATTKRHASRGTLEQSNRQPHARTDLLPHKGSAQRMLHDRQAVLELQLTAACGQWGSWQHRLGRPQCRRHRAQC